MPAIRSALSARTGLRARRGLGLLLAAVPAVLAAGCDRGEAADGAPPEIVDTRGVGRRGLDPDTPVAGLPVAREAARAGRTAVFVAYAGAFADSAGAARLRDSLARTGWRGYVRRVPGDSLPPWRVALEPSEGNNVAVVLAAGLRAAGLTAAVGRDSAVPVAVARELVPVNGGDRGAISRSRWTLSPDGRVLVAVDDPSAVENEPLPNALLVASETRRALAREDSVWDVAVSPDWRALAYGKAYVVTASTRDSITAREWFRIGYYTDFPAPIVRQNAYDVSRMRVALGFAQPVVLPLDSLPPSIGGAVVNAARRLAYPGGWRIRWVNPARLAVGTEPARIADDSPPTRWLAVDVATGLARGEIAAPARHTAWTEGPVLDVSVPLDRSPRRFEVAGGQVVSEGGWIRLERGGERRVLGAGIALAATRGGRYVLALVPDPQPAENAMPWWLAVYAVQP